MESLTAEPQFLILVNVGKHFKLSLDLAPHPHPSATPSKDQGQVLVVNTNP